MGNINLYRIDDKKKESCLEELNCSVMKKYEKESKELDNYKITLYLEEPSQSNKEISWNWALKELKQGPFYIFKDPKAVFIIEKNTDQKKTYAVTFGSSYFRIDKFCDRDFGFSFASRIKYTNVKTTTLTAPSLTRSKTVNTYIDYCFLDFNSGESFSKLKVNAELEEGFKIFNPSLEIGNSIKFNINNESIEGILNVIEHVENILKIPDENTIYKIPLFQIVKDDDLLPILNEKLDKVLKDVLIEKKATSLLFIPELEIIGANEVFNHIDYEFELKYQKNSTMKISSLTTDSLIKFCKENKINSVEKINKIKVIRSRNKEPVATRSIRNMMEYTDDENKCVFSGGEWYRFNRDYLSYLNNSIKEINSFYFEKYDFNDQVHNDFVESMYKKEKDNIEYKDKEESEIKKALKKKYYVERCFNMLREKENLFVNYDRKETYNGYEKMDLYEKATSTMFAVKKGKSSSDLCYAIDQSLTSLKKLKHAEIKDMPPIKNVGLWFILEREERLTINEGNKIDLCSLNMLMLKNRIDQWKKEVRLQGYNPVIHINYRS